MKLSKAQLCTVIQSRGFLGRKVGNVMGNLGKKAWLDLAVALTKDVLNKSK